MIPAVGDIYDRAIEDGTAYKVYAIGQRTGNVYVQLVIDDMPTAYKLEWPQDRWQALVAREGLTKRAT